MSKKISTDVKNTILDVKLLELMPRVLIEEFRAFIFEKEPKIKSWQQE